METVLGRRVEEEGGRDQSLWPVWPPLSLIEPGRFSVGGLDPLAAAAGSGASGVRNPPRCRLWPLLAVPIKSGVSGSPRASELMLDLMKLRVATLRWPLALVFALRRA